MKEDKPHSLSQVTSDDIINYRHDLMQSILERRSISPKRLVSPGPNREDIELIIQAAVTAPDHLALRPWRFLLIDEDHRKELGDVFASAKLRRAPDASPEEIQKEYQRAMHSPILLGVIGRISLNYGRVPEREQYVSIGAAVQNILLAAHCLGYGAMMVSGQRVFDPYLCESLGVVDPEVLIGFVCIGTVATQPKFHARPPVSDHFSIWTGEE